MMDYPTTSETGPEVGQGLVERRSGSYPQIFLQPIAAPALLGLFGFSIAAFMTGIQFAGWLEGRTGAGIFLPFASLVGGLAQFTAAMWAFKGRDGLSTAFHGIWGSFWLIYGLLNLFAALGLLQIPAAAIPNFGFWFIPLFFITLGCTVAALATNLTLFATLALLDLAALLLVIGLLTANSGVLVTAGWAFIVSSALGWYAGMAMVIEDSFGRIILPIGEFMTSRQASPVDSGIGEPGVLHGQFWGLQDRRVRQERGIS